MDSRDTWPAASLLGRLSPEARAGVLGAGTLTWYDRGTFLFHQGDHVGDAGHAVVLLSGCVRVVARTSSGKDALLAIRVGGDIVGEMAVFGDAPRSANVVAATRIRSRRIGRSELTGLLATYPEIGRVLTLVAHERLRWANRRRSDAASSLSALQRVRQVLADITDTYGTPVVGGVRLDVSLTQRDVASLAGVSRATVERAVRQLKDERLLVRWDRRSAVLTEPDRVRVVPCFTR